MIRRIVFVIFISVLGVCAALGQEMPFQKVKTHSHNDYLQGNPFFTAFQAQMNSVEVDLFLHRGRLVAAHERESIDETKTFNGLYLQPLAAQYQKNGNRVYPDGETSFQFLIDIKDDYRQVIPQLISELQEYAFLFDPEETEHPIAVVLSGNTPPPAEFAQYPAFLQFDGRPEIVYSAAELKRIGMISADIKKYSDWNGKGTPAVADAERLRQVVKDAHALGKTFRFWGTADGPNTWMELEALGVDWINTDRPGELQRFLQRIAKTVYVPQEVKPVFLPDYSSDGSKKAPKNIILMIGDGMGLAQIQAGITANRGALNLSAFRFLGLSRTRAANSEVTDSAAGATAMATGQKTNNRYVGTSPEGSPLPNLTTRLQQNGMKTGIISSGDITDATPAAFYAHQNERSFSEKIAADFPESGVELLIGSGKAHFLENAENPRLLELLEEKGYQLSGGLEALAEAPAGKALTLVEQADTRPVLDGRGPFLQRALQLGISRLSAPEGFFIMLEGAQIDHGGHQQDLPYVVSELLDFDQAVGEALRFASADGETLVIVTADHETGGLTLLGGDQSSGRVSGHFSTNDHTSVMVPVFAFGPGAQQFIGVYENTELFKRILQAKGGMER